MKIEYKTLLDCKACHVMKILEGTKHSLTLSAELFSGNYAADLGIYRPTSRFIYSSAVKTTIRNPRSFEMDLFRAVCFVNQ